MKSFHHGYLLAGDVGRAREEALKMASRILGVSEQKLAGHPDFSFVKKTVFSIDDARRMRESSSRKSFLGKGRVFLVESVSITREASNALLKTTEEPEGLNYFFIVTPNIENVLSTLRSRMAVLNFDVQRILPRQKIEFVKKFLKNGPDKRIEMTLVLSEEKEKALAFFDCLESVLSDNLKKDFSAENVDSLEVLMEQRNFAVRRGASLKMILEYLSFVLPRV